MSTLAVGVLAEWLFWFARFLLVLVGVVVIAYLLWLVVAELYAAANRTGRDTSAGRGDHILAPALLDPRLRWRQRGRDGGTWEIDGIPVRTGVDR